MENKKTFSFVFVIVAIIVGVALFKQFDSETLRFQKPALAVVYIITLVFSLFIIIRGLRGK
jgi:hypothetical protein